MEGGHGEEGKGVTSGLVVECRIVREMDGSLGRGKRGVDLG